MADSLPGAGPSYALKIAKELFQCQFSQEIVAVIGDQLVDHNNMTDRDSTRFRHTEDNLLVLLRVVAVLLLAVVDELVL